jgi:hypothetical protein
LPLRHLRKVITMKHRISILVGLTLLLALTAAGVKARIVPYDRGVDYASNIIYDRFLDVEIWTDDDEYYEGENIRIYFKADHDCYVAIYNVDTRGGVNLLYPSGGWDSPWIEGGEIYEIPGQYDEFDLTVQGPEGIEYLQIVASREPFPIPDWYDGSGLVCYDDPFDYMDFINAGYFDCERGCRRAFDITSFRVNEWHRHYFRPVYVYHYYDYPRWGWGWDFYGSAYINYPFGATIYIDGVYWGIAPLFIPRIYYGWHYITIYDQYGYCWEDRVNIYRRKSIILDDNIIRTRPNVKSRFKEVTKKAYLDPAKNGYPDYKKQVSLRKSTKPVTKAYIESRNKASSGKTTRTAYKSRYKTSGTTATKQRESQYKPSSKEKRSSGKTGTVDKTRKSSGDSKSSTTYKSRKTTTSKSSGKSSGVRKSSKSSTSKARKSSTGSSSSSSGVKKSSSGTTSSKSADVKKSSPSGSTTTKRGR